jgi:hypothetical protein
MGEEIVSKIVFICSDMWEPYLKVIREKCSQALHILDRFHIVAKMNKALDEVRAEETRRMKREGHDPVLKKSRWLLLKRSENLGDEQHFRLRDLLRYNLKTIRAYLLQDFVPTESSNWPSTTHLASYPSRNQPTISSDESLLRQHHCAICFCHTHPFGRTRARFKRGIAIRQSQGRSL